MIDSNPATEPTGQNLIKLISNLCFSAFVFSVLIFTVIAITYQPPDPWLESTTALTKLFTKSQNATFQTDNSIINTGEDLASVLPPAASPNAAETPITEVAIEKIENQITNSTPLQPDCEKFGFVNYSYPRVDCVRTEKIQATSLG